MAYAHSPSGSAVAGGRFTGSVSFNPSISAGAVVAGQSTPTGSMTMPVGGCAVAGGTAPPGSLGSFPESGIVPYEFLAMRGMDKNLIRMKYPLVQTPDNR